MGMKMMEKRIEWIDCAKFIAVIAVVTDHCNGILYTNPFIANTSYFSVSLFVLLSGISTWIAYQRGKNISFISQFEKVKKLFFAYAVATFIVLCILQHRFDLKTYLAYLFAFNIQGPYYYIVFFIQLVMISPVLIKVCKFANDRKNKWFIHLLIVCFLGWFAYISINYTYILPVHGGGQFLLGGTYVVLYYLGMMLSSNKVFVYGGAKRLFITLVCTGASVLWVALMTKRKLPFDSWMSPYWGAGFNPPSISFMVYSLFVLFICYGVFSLLSESKIQKIIFIICFMGKNTLYIWLYHLLVRDFFIKKFSDLLSRNILIRLIVFCIIIILPVIVKLVVSIVSNFCYNNICSIESEYNKK